MKYERNYELYLDQDNEVKLDAPTALKTLIHDYYAAKQTIMHNPYGCVDEVISANLMNNIEYYLEELEALDQDALSLDQKIWRDSFIFNLKLEYTNYELETRYLGGNPSDMDKCFPLSYYNLWVVDNLNDALDVFERDVANNLVYDDHHHPILNPTKMAQFEFKMNSYLQYLIALQNNLSQGMLNDVIPCRIVARLTARNLLVNLYPNELKYFAINQALSTNLPPEARTNYALKYLDVVSDEKYHQLAHQIQVHLDRFMDFYLRDYVPYCLTSTHSYGGDADDLFIFDQQLRVEVEQTYVVNDHNELKYIYGLGLTDHDLHATHIGLGGMQSSHFSGADYYQHYLDICNTTQATPAKVFQIGYELTKSTYHQMELIAYEVAHLLQDDAGNWTPSVMFDPDGIGPQLPSLTKCDILVNHQLNLNAFNQWLNQEDAFFGREVDYWTPTTIQASLTNPNYQTYHHQLVSAGYQPWLTQPHVDNKTHAIPGNQAFAGALASMASANSFKAKVTDYLHSYFYQLKQDYQICPYNIAVQEIWGAGQEGLNMFGYNINPYYSEHKWAFPSFIVHEAVPGHHTQLAYWTRYFKGAKDANQKPIPYFSCTGFHEGWAVFMEWFGAQANLYGLTIENDQIVYRDDVSHLDFSDANIETFQNGFYYRLAHQTTNPTLVHNQANLKAVAVKLAKLLTFYGYLNAAQLRNIRLVVDTCLHADFDTHTNDIHGLCSLADVRHFIQQYSAIGIGDQMNESKRYLAWPGQATSYMLGKVVFHELFSDISHKHLKDNGSVFFDYHHPSNQHTGPLFDLMLRNGEIPLNVLSKYVKWVYKL